MSVECQVNVKSQYELDNGGRETCNFYNALLDFVQKIQLFVVRKFILDDTWSLELELNNFPQTLMAC